jgi:alkylhydroperoxidase family enzyme
MTRPRIAPGTLREVGLLAWLIAHVGGRQAHSSPLTLFLTLGRHRRLFRGWLRFAARLMPRGRLPRLDTELVILRVAYLRSCQYEYLHHVRIGARAGLTAADIERVQDGPGAPGWSPRQRAILSAADELHGAGDLAEDTWVALREHLDELECIELCLLVGHYEMLATTITALRIQPEQPRRTSQQISDDDRRSA